MAAAVNAPQTHRVVKGASHYFTGQPEEVKIAANHVKDWLAVNF